MFSSEIVLDLRGERGFVPRSFILVKHSHKAHTNSKNSDGEMLLVLGRPGSGCSTFLKAVTNKRDSFAGVEGDVS